MSFDEIKTAVLALPEAQRVELSSAITDSLGGDFPLDVSQQEELRAAMAEAAADPEDGEDAFEAIARVRAELRAARPGLSAAQA